MYHIDNMIEAEVLKQVPHLVDMFNEAWTRLSAHNHTSRRPYDYNDLNSDAHVLKVPDGKSKAIVFGDNTFAYGGRKTVVYYKNIGRRQSLAAYRVWDRNTRDSYNTVARCTAHHLASNNFDWRAIGMYGDCRDEGYIFRWDRTEYALPELEGAADERIDRCGTYYPEIKTLFHGMNNLSACLSLQYDR